MVAMVAVKANSVSIYLTVIVYHMLSMHTIPLGVALIPSEIQETLKAEIQELAI
jgi:hypothetical protein